MSGRSARKVGRIGKRLSSLSPWLPITLLIGAMTIAAVASWYLLSPKELRIAIPPPDDPAARIVTALAQALKAENSEIRLKLVPTNSLEDSGRALQQDNVDLAIVRPDAFLPANGLTVAVLRSDEVILLAADTNLAHLAQKRIGVVTHHQADLQTVQTILAFHGLSPPAVTFKPIAPSSAADALARQQVDALAAVVIPGQAAEDFVANIRKGVEQELALVPLNENADLEAEAPAYSSRKIPAGSLGLNPPLPAEDTGTVSITYRLMADADLDRDIVARLTEAVFQLRSRIAQMEPTVNLMTAPDLDAATSAALPNHPGALDYLTREQQSFMDRYGDWMWLGLFVAGGVSSAGAWLLRTLARQHEIANEELDELLEIAARARSADSIAVLDDLGREIDLLITRAVRDVHADRAGTRSLPALMLAIDMARAAVHDRRSSLHASVTAPPPSPRLIGLHDHDRA